ncbi:MAG: PRC-barrel domain-containing protein [Actinobacteria bacterium]|nr:PRC-barrel domain-containing protein [Actinomycetota bacterium]
MPARAVLATVGKPFGLAGDVYLWLDPDLGDALTPGLHVTAGTRELEIATVRHHRGRSMVRFVGIDDRASVDALRGVPLQIDRAAVTADDLIWADEVLGREVVDASGALVGVVEALLDGPAHDYLSVARPDGGEVLIPVVDELVDMAEPIVVHGPPGLIDPADALE